MDLVALVELAELVELGELVEVAEVVGWNGSRWASGASWSSWPCAVAHTHVTLPADKEVCNILPPLPVKLQCTTDYHNTPCLYHTSDYDYEV